MPKYIETYNHQNRIGVMIEFQCKDDWALRTEEFRVFAHDLVLHIAANGSSEDPLITQLFVKNTTETVGHQFRIISEVLGARVSVTRYEYYDASQI